MVIIILIILSLLTFAVTVAYSFKAGRHTVRSRHYSNKILLLAQLPVLGVVFLFGLLSFIYTSFLVGMAILRPTFYDAPIIAKQSLMSWMAFTHYSLLALIFLIPTYYWNTRIKHIEGKKARFRALVIIVLKAFIPCFLLILALIDFNHGDDGFLHHLNYWPAD